MKKNISQAQFEVKFQVQAQLKSQVLAYVQCQIKKYFKAKGLIKVIFAEIEKNLKTKKNLGLKDFLELNKSYLFKNLKNNE